MNIRYIILALLAQQPMSGYDIKSLFKDLTWMIGTPSYGSLYPTLHTLLEQKFVDVRVETREAKPPRKIYSVTADGREHLDAWLSQPYGRDLSIKTFAHRLIGAGNLSASSLTELLAQRRSQIANYLDRSSRDREDQEAEAAQNLGQGLIHDYGLAIARAELLWLDAQLAALSPPRKTLSTRARVSATGMG